MEASQHVCYLPVHENMGPVTISDKDHSYLNLNNKLTLNNILQWLLHLSAKLPSEYYNSVSFRIPTSPFYIYKIIQL